VDKPGITQPCATCTHPFGEHYRTFDNRSGGCINGRNDQRAGPCHCQQFTTAFIPTVQFATTEEVTNCLEDLR
jgi:hypothetical protein